MSFFNPIWHHVKGRKTGQRYTWSGKRASESTTVTGDIMFTQQKQKIQDKTIKHRFMKKTNDNPHASKLKQEIIWLNVFFITVFHVIAVYTYVFKVWETKFLSILWGMMIGFIGGFGITAGVHRLWAHRSYKATLPLQVILLICYTIAGQNDVREWVRDHRVHHRFSETDADPHNSNRGLFFSHVGWLMMKKHPEVTNKGKTVDISDIMSDPLLSFHSRYFLYFKLILCFILPTLVPVYCWNETWKIAILSQCFARYVTNLNFTWSVNSLAHKWGSKPYNKYIKPTQNLAVCVMAMGEGFHNYHHIFPWDYKAAELGNYSFNVTTFWLDLFAKIGWAYDLRTPSRNLVQNVVQKYGKEYPNNTPDLPLTNM